MSEEQNSLVSSLKDEITHVDDEITIRPARSEDVSQIFALVNKAYEIENGDTGVAFKVMDAPRYRAEKEVSDMLDSFLLLTHSRDGLVGCVSLKYNGIEAEFGSFAVDPEKQGKGLGNILFNEIIERCKRRKMAKVLIYVVNLRTDVLPYYRKRGFVEYGTREWLDGCCFGDEKTLSRPVHFVLMEKVL